ncbi:MAG TPA: hypothetical protein VFF52_01005 [Isosphaeraceae bacterium]|jgi:hypothetical protein|nr:hypothetical protein [Isosphaeraceae bacterium]
MNSLRRLFALLGLWSIGDAAWLLLAPRGWARWWGGLVSWAGRSFRGRLLLALLEAVIGLWLVARAVGEERAGTSLAG